MIKCSFFNFRRAFPGLCSRNVVCTSQCRSEPSSLTTLAPKKKNQMMGYVPMRFQALETWTHDFCVLSRGDEDTTPSRERLEALISAGLGKARRVFPDNRAGHNQVHFFLAEKFPRLKQAGGFEV